MALRLRRGTDAERQIITPVEGELVYVTDTKELYIGDGTTVGGLRVTGEVADTLDGLSDVDAALPQDGDVLVYDSLTSEWESVQLPLVDLPDVDADGISDGQVLAWNSSTQTFVPANNEGGGGSSFVGELIGSVFGDDSTALVDAVNSKIVGDIQSGTGDFIGTVNANEFVSAFGTITDLTSVDIYATEISADNMIADTFTGTLIGTITGNITGDLNGSVFGDDSSLLVDAVNNVLTGNIQTTNIDLVDQGRLVLTKSGGNRINEVRLEAFQTRNRLNINTVDKTGDLSSYTGYYGTLNFGFEDATTDRADATIRGAASDMRLAHDTVTTLIDDESKYFTLKEGKFGFGTYTPEVKMDVRGPIRPGVYADTAARDAAIPTPTAGMMIFVTDGDGAGNPKFQGNTDGTTGGWADLN